MELKWLIWISCNFGSTCSNRTFMELKYHVSISADTIRNGSNRTFMELKLINLH